MKRILLFLLVILFTSKLEAQGIGYGCPDILDQQQGVYNVNYLSTDHYQSFTAGATGKLTRFDVYTNACTAYNYTISIYSGTGTGGTLLYTAPYVNSGICNNWLPSVFPTASAPSVVSGNVYTMRIQTSIASMMQAQSTGPYGGGIFFSLGYGVLPGVDMTFRTYVQATTYPSANITALSSLSFCPNGTVALNANAGTFSYAWYNTSGVIATSTAQTYTASTVDSYAAVITNTVNNCYNTSNTLTTISNTVAQISSSTTICSGSNVTLTSIPSGTFAWSTSATTSSIVVGPNVYSQYLIQAIAPSSCATETLYSVYVNNSPTLSVNNQTASVYLGNIYTNNSDFSTVYWPFSDPLPAGAKIVAYEYDYDGVDQGWGGSGCYLSTNVSGDWTGGAVLSHTSTHFNYLVPTSAPGYTYGTTNQVGLAFCGWGGWQSFANNFNLIIHYYMPTNAACSGAQRTLTASGADTYTWSPLFTNGTAITPTSTSIYTISAAMANGCTASRTINVVATPNPTLSLTGQTTVCVGSSISQSITGADSYSWSTGSNTDTENLSPSGALVYSVTGTNTLTGCASTGIYTVNGLARPTIAISNYTICNGSTATLVPTGASTYTFSSGNATVSPISTTSYSISGTSTAGCTSTAVAVSTVVVNALPGVTAGGVGVICSGKSTTITAGSADTYSWSTGATGSVAVLSPTGTTQYSVVGTNTTTGCKATAVVNVSVNPLPPIAASSATICNGKSYTFTPSGGISYTYSAGSAIVSPTTTTSYTITGIDANNCTNSVVPSVVVFTVPNIAATSGTMCSGKSYTVNPSGAISYTITDGTTTTITAGSTTLTPAATSNYTISGNSINGCRSVSDAVITVTVYNLPTISAPSQTMCAGQTITFSPIGASSYTWSPAGPIVSPASTTTYVLMGTSSVGCTNTAAIAPAATVYSLPIISVSGGSICSGNTFTFIPTGAVSYVYSSGSSTVSPSSTTQYSVYGTSSQGCASTLASAVTVTVYATPTISVNSGAICSGNIFTMTPSGAATYVFSGPGTATVSPTANAQYSVSGTSTAGCTSTTSAIAQVTVNALPSISVNSGTICQGGIFTITPSGAASYMYSSGSNTVNPMTTSSYSVSGTSSLGCVSATLAVATVTVFNTPSIAVNTGSICSGQVFTIIPSGAASYVYSGGSNTVSPISTSSYSVNGTSAAGCNSSVSAVCVVSVETTPTISAASGSICFGASYTLQPTGATTYSYQGGSAVVSPNATSNFLITGYSPNACASTPITVTVSVNALPQVVAVFNPSIICFGASATPVASGAQTYVWTGNLTNNTSKQFTSTATHTVIGTDANGCSNTFTTAILVNSLPTLTVVSTNSVSCEAETVTLSVSGASTYTWSNNLSTTAIIQSPTVTTVYTVSGIDANSCANTSIFTQSVVPCAQSFNAFSTITDVECEGKKNGKIEITATAGYSTKTYAYLWTTPSLCPTANCSTIDSLDEGIYSVKVIMTYTLNGLLVKKDSLTLGPLKVEDDNPPCNIDIFRGISANGDGHNDFIFIENIQLYPKNKVSIFNRWGDLISQIEAYDNVNKVWPPAADADKVPASTYFYIIDLNDGTKPNKGWIEIIK